MGNGIIPLVFPNRTINGPYRASRSDVDILEDIAESCDLTDLEISEEDGKLVIKGSLEDIKKLMNYIETDGEDNNE